jgi:hypothetical protein
MGMQIWMSWTIVIYILLSVWVACFDTKKGFFLWERNVFLVENFAFFLFFRKFAKFSMPKHGKRNHDLDVECKSQGVFLQFWMFTFLSFQGRNTFFPNSIFTFIFIVAWSINQVLLPHLEGRMDKLGFKSHRLPY